MIALAVLATVPILDAHWHTVLACPRVACGRSVGTGVVIGVKDDFAYLLTANHVATADQVEVRFSPRKNDPESVWYGEGATVVARWPDPDVALVRFPLHGREPPVLPLAPAWRRPKAFPTPARSVGLGSGEAAVARGEILEAKEFVKREGRGAAFFWRTKLPSEPGRSGGALLDESGRVIGIVVAARGGAGYHAHHDEILAALKRDGYGWLIPPGKAR